MSRRFGALAIAAAALAFAPAGAPAQPIDNGIQSEQVKNAVALENAKLDLAMCASELNQLAGTPDSQALEDSVSNPDCRRAILKAQASGMSKSQIVTVLMGGAGVPDSKPNTPPPGAGSQQPSAPSGP